MALTKEKKVEVVKDLESALKGVKSVVFVNFHKLPVKDADALRKSLREQKVGYKVAKKTLIKRALSSIKPEGEMPALEGEVAIAYGADDIAPAREVYAFQKSHKDSISILGGVFEGKYLSKEAMLEIATIPPMDVLYSKLAFLVKSPLQRIAIALSEVAKTKS